MLRVLRSSAFLLSLPVLLCAWPPIQEPNSNVPPFVVYQQGQGPSKGNGSPFQGATWGYSTIGRCRADDGTELVVAIHGEAKDQTKVGLLAVVEPFDAQPLKRPVVLAAAAFYSDEWASFSDLWHRTAKMFDLARRPSPSDLVTWHSVGTYQAIHPKLALSEGPMSLCPQCRGAFVPANTIERAKSNATIEMITGPAIRFIFKDSQGTSVSFSLPKGEIGNLDQMIDHVKEYLSN